jgi:hypothetical protein
MDTAENTETATRSAKDEVRALLDRLPDDATLEDIEYSVMVVRKVPEGEESLAQNGGIPHEEVKRRTASWFKE